MAGNSVEAMEAAGLVALAGVIIGLIAWPFEPKLVPVWFAQIPRFILVFLVPAVGLVFSAFLLLFVQCDPLVVSHSPKSRASVAATIVLPTATALVFHVIILWAGLAGHELGTFPIMFVSGLVFVGLAGIFFGIEQNYVVGVRDVWTLRSPEVWRKTHEWAYKFYGIAGIALVVLAFVVPSGFWAFITILGLFLVPTVLSVGYSYLVREDQYNYIVR